MCWLVAEVERRFGVGEGRVVEVVGYMMFEEMLESGLETTDEQFVGRVLRRLFWSEKRSGCRT